MIPEFVKAVVDFINTTKQHYASLIKSKAEIEAALTDAANAPRRTDIVLEDNDVVTEDMTLTPSCRLFFKPRGANTEIKLTGNGFSLRFEGDQLDVVDEAADVPVAAAYDASSPPLLFVPEGVTLYLVDMVLENFQKNAISLGDNAQVKGVVQMANPVSKVSLRGSRAKNASPFARRLTRSVSVLAMDTTTPSGSDVKSPLSSPADDIILSPRSDLEDPVLSPSRAVIEDKVPVKKEMLVFHLYSERIEMHVLDSIFTEATPVASSRRRGSRSTQGTLPRADRSYSSFESLHSEDGTGTDDGTGLTDERTEGTPRTTRGLTRLRSPTISKPTLSKLKLSRIASDTTAAPLVSGNRVTSYSTFDIGLQLSLHVKPTQKIEGMNISQDLDPGIKSDINIKVEAKDVVATTTTRMEADGAAISRAEIVSPSGATVDVFLEEDLETYEVDVAIEPVQVNVAFSTVQLGMIFARTYTSILRADPSKIGIAAQQKEIQKEDNKRSVRVSCAELSAQLIDDSQASVFPLLQAKVYELDSATGIHRGKVDGDDDEEYTKSMLTMRVSADSMNQALVEWEPVIEPCAVVVEAVVFIEPQTAAAVVGDTEVIISAKEALNVNVTRNFLLAMQTALENWKGVLAGPRLAISNMETAYKLRNETADKITLWLTQDSSEGPQGNVLLAGQELGFSLAARGTINRGEHAKIMIGLPGYKPEMIDMDRIGFQNYRFVAERVPEPSKKKQRGRRRNETRSYVTIACNLFLDGPTKVASLRAILFVENDTEEPIHLTLKEPAAGFDDDMVPGDYVVIRPDGGTSIDAYTEKIWIRRDSRFLWAPVKVPTPKDGLRTEQVQAISRAINLAAGITCFATSADSTNGAVSLHIMPTLAIHNRLPCVMNARVYRYENTGKTECMFPGQKMEKLITADQQALAWEGSLRPGEVSHQCFGSSADHLLLSVTADGFSWSEPVIVESPVHFAAKALEMQDQKRRVLTLGLDNRTGTEERCWRSVAVFCSCWIVNLTGLPLLYSASLGLVELTREGHATAAGEPAEGNTSSQPVLIGWQRASFKVADTTASGGTLATIGETAESEWSKPFSTTAIRTSGVSSVIEKENSKDVRHDTLNLLVRHLSNLL